MDMDTQEEKKEAAKASEKTKRDTPRATSAFGTPVDYFGLDGTPLKLKSSKEGKSAEMKEPPNARGDTIARTVFGEVSKPSCDFEVIASDDLELVLGTVHTVDSVVYILSGATITTKFGEPCAVAVSGESLQAGATVSSTITVGAIALSMLHKAVALGTAFTLGGVGVELHECSAEITSKPSRATVNGETVSHDIAGGKIVIKATICQTESTKPTITAGEGFEITAPLTCDNPDADYPTWTVELTKDLASVEPTPAP
jgi:hypothetical protein